MRAAPENQKSRIREAYLRSGRQAYQAAVGARRDAALPGAGALYRPG